MNHNQFMIRWLLPFTVLIGMIFLLVACGGSTPETTASEEPAKEAPVIEAPASNDPIHILEWSGYEVTDYPNLFPSFSEAYTPTLDEAVEYTFFADDAEALAKLRSGFSADLVHPCESWWGLYVENDLLQPIDTSRIADWDSINPDLAKLGQFNGQQYILPWEWGYESILVRSDLVTEIPDSWGDLWDPQYAGRVMIWDSAQSNYALTALTLGIEDPLHNITPENVERVKQKLIELKPNLLTYWSDYTQTYDMPATGEAWLTASAWQDAYGYLDSEGIPVAYIQPVEGRLGWACGYAITKDAQNLDLVYEFLNSAASPESSAELGNYYWYGGANVDALPLVDEYVVDLMELDQVDTLFERTVFYQPMSEEQRQLITQMWDEVKAAP